MRKLAGTLLLISLGALITYTLLNKFLGNRLKFPLALETSIVSPIQSAAQWLMKRSLKDEVESALAGSSGTYGVVIRNLKTGQSYSLNEHRVFEPASLYKIWVMAAAFEQIEKGSLAEDEVLTQDIPVLNEEFQIATEEAEMTDGTITLTVKDAIEQMITISHNYAALLLAEKIKLSTIQSFLKENGFNESTVGTNGGLPTSTPLDIASFFEKLYQGELANKRDAREMLDILKKQTLNNKLPKYLPEGIAIAHKTGELGSSTHDAGIVFSNKGNYLIVVMSESDLPPAAEERIAKISRAVYNYWQ